jgi:hypothetical protein
VLGGGVGGGLKLAIQLSSPLGGAGWDVEATNIGPTAGTVAAIAVCANVN